MFSLGFDTESLAKLAELAGFSVLLTARIQAAMIEAGQTITDAAVANTWDVFEHPTGALASTIYPWVPGPGSIEIRADSPYARRREYGFSGMTDSLGRHFTNDPGKPYMQPALDDNEDTVLQLIEDAVIATMEEMGVSF